MSAYVYSPDFAPNAFVFGRESQSDVLQTVSGWMRDGALVEIPAGIEEHSIVVHFGRVRSVDVSLIEKEPGYVEALWSVKSLNDVRVVS